MQSFDGKEKKNSVKRIAFRSNKLISLLFYMEWKHITLEEVLVTVESLAIYYFKVCYQEVLCISG